MEEHYPSIEFFVSTKIDIKVLDEISFYLKAAVKDVLSIQWNCADKGLPKFLAELIDYADAVDYIIKKLSKQPRKIV